MKPNVWFTALVGPDLDFTPLDISDARTQSFDCRFLGRPPCSQRFDAPSALGAFCRREDTFHEAITVASNHIGNPLDFDEVDAYRQHGVTPGQTSAQAGRGSGDGQRVVVGGEYALCSGLYFFGTDGIDNLGVAQQVVEAETVEFHVQ
jgi:hypothetical protein